jgi:hypothetical protein
MSFDHLLKKHDHASGYNAGDNAGSAGGFPHLFFKAEQSLEDIDIVFLALIYAGLMTAMVYTDLLTHWTIPSLIMV